MESVGWPRSVVICDAAVFCCCEIFTSVYPLFALAYLCTLTLYSALLSIACWVNSVP
jgi:hypothetical protein